MKKEQIKKIDIYKTEINDLSYLCKVIAFLELLLDETELIFDGKDIRVMGMDPSRICMFDIIIKNILKKPINLKVKCLIEWLRKTIEPYNLKEVALDITDTALIFHDGFEKFTLKREKIGDIDIMSFNNLRKIDYTCNFEVTQEALIDIIKKCKVFSEIMTISCYSGGNDYEEKACANFSSTSNWGGCYIGDFPYDNSAAFSLSFLSIMQNTLFSGITFKMSLKTNHPLKIVYEDERLWFEFYLAPRVEEADFYDDDNDMDDF